MSFLLWVTEQDVAFDMLMMMMMFATGNYNNGRLGDLGGYKMSPEEVGQKLIPYTT